MSYPFSEAPTLGRFIEVAEGHGATLCRANDIVGPKGRVRVEYLLIERQGKSPLFTEPLPTDHDTRVGPDLLRRLCRQLGISAKEFGLNLG